jgi:tRNA threonylcarbamoyladenosine biosynthesis protein TsaB
MMTNAMLALDTSQGTAVAVLRDGAVVSEKYEPNTMRHAEQIGQLIAQALSDAKLRPDEISSVAVGVGPAPFTGLRVGIAAAKLFAQGVAAPLFAVGSLDAAAFDLEISSPTLLLSDARRGEVYFALYEAKDRFGVPIATSGPGVKKLAELQQELSSKGVSYQSVQAQISAGSIGKLAMALLAAGKASQDVSALYLRAPDASPSKGKKVSG